MNFRLRRFWLGAQRLFCHRYSRLVLLGLGLVWLLPVLGYHPALAQSVTQAQVTEILDGNQVFIQERQVAINSVAQRQQRVRTASARAELQFNTGAIARLAQNSSLTVGDCAQLRRGTVLVNGPLNGCTTSTLAGVRGTLYTLEVDEADQTIIRVFEGEVMVSPRPADEVTPEDRAPEPPLPTEADLKTGKPLGGILVRGKSSPGRGMLPKQEGTQADPAGSVEPVTPNDAAGEAEKVPLSAANPVSVQEGQQITVASGAQEGVVRELSLEDFQTLFSGPLLSNFTSELPGLSELQGSFERLFPGVPFPISLPSIPTPGLPSFPF